MTGELILNDFDTIKPTQEPQVKNGEQPGHSLSLSGIFFVSSFFEDTFAWQSLSEQHGFVESTIT
jgi:hypothetical protein